MVRVVLYGWSKLGIKVWPGHERRPGRRRDRGWRSRAVAERDLKEKVKKG